MPVLLAIVREIRYFGASSIQGLAQQVIQRLVFGWPTPRKANPKRNETPKLATLNMKKATLLAMIALLTSAGLGFANPAIESVMKEAFKGDTSLYKKVATGKGSEADAKRLLGYVKTLTENEPPKGEKAAWDKKTGELLAAVDKVAKGNKQGMLDVQKSGNCKSCHSAHKPD